MQAPANLTPPPPDYVDDLGQHSLAEDLEETVTFLIQHKVHISLPQRERLREAVKLPGEEAIMAPAEPVGYGTGFDLGAEVEAQIQAVRAVRSTVMKDGRIIDGVSSREAKEVISSGSTLLNTLMKFHEKVLNMDRLRMLEAAVIEVLGEESEDLRERVVESMEQKLEDASGK